VEAFAELAAVSWGTPPNPRAFAGVSAACSNARVKRRTWERALALLATSLVVAEGLVACGARTGLLVIEQGDAGIVVRDSRADTFEVPDATFDGDAEPDTIVTPDSLPPIDVNPADVVIVGCVDAGATQIYLMSSQAELYSFYPPTLAFMDIGPIVCPSAGSPNSMGVDRTGTAYVNFTDGTLSQVDTATAACGATPFNSAAFNFSTQFGMGYVGDPADGGDTLHVGSDSLGMAMQTQASLATIDTTTFTLNLIGPFAPASVFSPELTGTGDGRLFVFYANPNDPTMSSSLITQVDPNTAQEIASNEIPGVVPGSDYAFAFYGGNFYIFTSQAGEPSAVTEFIPSTNTANVVAMAPEAIVGAGVSTCAPMQ
jgi:hypothetical protein